MILVTGSAGFIGFHTARRLLEGGDRVVGLDNLNPYYDVSLKEARLARLEGFANYRHYAIDLADRQAMRLMFEAEPITKVAHLAAQPGVRHSLEHPEAYVDTNVVGFLSVLEGCRARKVEHLVFASTSSAYGANGKQPSSPHDSVSHPLTLYSASKIANEAMAHAYAHLFGFPCTGLRFFTVYGPWGRPDMALFKFTRAILEGHPIDVYGAGQMRRDFTYVDDIVDGVIAALNHPPAADPNWDPQSPDPATSGVAPWRMLNLGNGKPEELMRYIAVLEEKLGKKAQLNLMPMQPGDAANTAADITDSAVALGYAPKTDIAVGVGKFVDWYLGFYGGRNEQH